MKLLKLTTCQAENTHEVGHALAAYAAEQLSFETRFVDDLHWRERERLLDAGEIQAGWICGLPYVLKVDRSRPDIALLAAPIMAEARYQDRPIYFSDVVVRTDSPFRTFADLRGSTFAYNEPNSQSGYNIVRYHLATLNERSGYFGRVVESGAHLASLRLILNGEIDAAAIDTTVLAWFLARQPEMNLKLRTIATLGPSPAPPWVISTRVDAKLRHALQELLLHMHKSRRGRAVLRVGGIARFARVSNNDYDPIRRMYQTAASVQFGGE